MPDKLVNGKTPVTVNECNERHLETRRSIGWLKAGMGALIAVGICNGVVNYQAMSKASILEAQVLERKEGVDRMLMRIEVQLDRIEEKLSHAP